MVRKVKCKDFSGLNVKKVDDVDVNITAGTESLMFSGGGLGPASSREDE